MSRVLSFLVVVLLTNKLCAQEQLPYKEVPQYPEEFTAGTMASRMVDALGFRYYWATDSLTETHLVFKGNHDGRSIEETIYHIYDLSKIIVNSTLKKPNLRYRDTLSYNEMRYKTLLNFKIAADILRESDDISQYKIVFGEREIPFWNQVNGPIADAIWHCGQIAMNRRTSGNPINPKVNHFSGRLNN